MQNSRFWKTKVKYPIFCKDISQLWQDKMGCVNSYFEVADKVM